VNSEMSKTLTWKDFKPDDVEHLRTLVNPADLLKFLQEFFHLNPDSPQDAILLDFYSYNITFASESRFSADKLSSFFSIMKNLFDTSMAHPHWTWEESFAHFKTVLLTHSVQRPPYSVQIFSLEDITLISDYALSSFFRHYKLYQYTFIPQHVMSLETQNIFRPVVTPPVIPPLAQGTPEAEILAKNIQWPEEDEDEKKETIDNFHFDQVNADTVSKAIQAALHAQMLELKKTLQAHMEEQDRMVAEKLGLPPPTGAAGHPPSPSPPPSTPLTGRK